MSKIISFPHLGNYYVAFNYFLSKCLKCKVIVPPSNSKKTIMLGDKYSPTFVCAPFKFNLGNYIEALDKGANVLIQGGGGCRYGYYGELQEKILRDLGYEFEFYNLIYDNHVSLKKGYKFCKKMNKRTNPLKCLYYLFNTILMIIFIDNIERYMRHNMGFEVVKDSFEKLEKEYLNTFKGNGIIKNIYLYKKYKKKFKKLAINKPSNYIKVKVLGELYTLMNDSASCNIEKKLIKMRVDVDRKTDLTYLLITKRFILPRLIKRGKEYIKYHLGADASGSVVLSAEAGINNYDGILHLKSFGCTPEISAMSIMPKISSKYNIPILYFSFDAEDNEVGVDTRLEAFYDMILMKRENK